MHVCGYDPKMYMTELKKIRMEVKECPGLMIVATDISEDAVNIARINARMAAVEDLIEFRVCDFADTAVPQPAEALFFNPEYGDRLGERSVCNLFINAWAIFSNNYAKGTSGIFLQETWSWPNISV